MNNTYERIAELMLEDRKNPPLHMSALHHRYRRLRAYMAKHHPELLLPPEGEEGIEFAGGVPAEKYLKRSGK